MISHQRHCKTVIGYKYNQKPGTRLNTLTINYSLSRLASPHVYFTTLRNRQLVKRAQHMAVVYWSLRVMTFQYWKRGEETSASGRRTCYTRSALVQGVIGHIARIRSRRPRATSRQRRRAQELEYQHSNSRTPAPAPRHALTFFTHYRDN